VTTLEGKTDLDVSGLNGIVNLKGTVEISVDIRVHIVLGVDADGFYIDPDAPSDGSGSPEPELVVSNIQVGGDISASGRLGFLTVTFTGAALTVDPEVAVAIDLVEPGPDPFTGVTDGLIRTYELFPFSFDLITAGVQGNPSADDLTLSGALGVSAVFPFGGEPFSLPEANITLTWADINDPFNFDLTVSEDTITGKLLSMLLDMDMKDLLLPVLEEMDKVGDQILAIESLDAELPIIDTSINDLLTGGDSPGVGDLLKLYDPVAALFQEAEANNERLSFTDILDVVVKETTGKLEGSAFDGSLIQEDGKTLLSFDVAINITPEFEFDFDLSDILSDTGMVVDASAQVRIGVDLMLDFSFGLDLTNLLDNGSIGLSDVFFELHTLTATAILDAGEIDLTVELEDFPFGVESAAVTLIAGADVKFRDTSPAVNGRIYLPDLMNGSFSSLFEVTPFGELHLDLPFFANLDTDPLGGFGFVATGNFRIQVDSDDIFGPVDPDVIIEFEGYIMAFGQKLEGNFRLRKTTENEQSVVMITPRSPSGVSRAKTLTHRSCNVPSAGWSRPA